MIISLSVVKFKRNSKSSRRNVMCSWDRFLSGAYRDFLCVDCEAYTVNGNNHFPVLITLIIKH